MTNKRGFIFLETIIVTVVVMTSLTLLLANFNLLRSLSKARETYDNVEDLYLLSNLVGYGNFSIKELDNVTINTDNCKDYMTPACSSLFSEYSIVELHVLSNIDTHVKGENDLKNSTIEYLKTLDKTPEKKYVIGVIEKDNKLYYASLEIGEKDYTFESLIKRNNIIYPSDSPSEYVHNASGINYTAKASDSNGLGLYFVSGEKTTNGEASYFFRGNVENNYFNIFNSTYRIVRIDEFGNIKLVKNDSIGKSKYNEQISGVYPIQTVGYMYDLINPFDNNIDSTLKKYLDNWYRDNILDSEEEKFISDGIFCNNRTYEMRIEFSDQYIFKGWLMGQINGGNTLQSFSCPARDSFSAGNIGNSSLVYPVGILSFDEYVYSGVGQYTMENGSYVKDMQINLTPLSSDTSGENFEMTVGGSLNNETMYDIFPSIYIKGSVIVTGSGTLTDPYRIKE